MGNSARWYEDDRVPTRLGDETLNIYLAVWQDGVLRPLRAKDSNPWEQSAVRVRASIAQRFDTPKTKEFAQVLSNLNVDTKVLVVVESSNDFALLSARNIPNVT